MLKRIFYFIGVAVFLYGISVHNNEWQNIGLYTLIIGLYQND